MLTQELEWSETKDELHLSLTDEEIEEVSTNLFLTEVKPFVQPEKKRSLLEILCDGTDFCFDQVSN